MQKIEIETKMIEEIPTNMKSNAEWLIMINQQVIQFCYAVSIQLLISI